MMSIERQIKFVVNKISTIFFNNKHKKKKKIFSLKMSYEFKLNFNYNIFFLKPMTLLKHFYIPFTSLVVIYLNLFGL
jgi:hypothetical protein